MADPSPTDDAWAKRWIEIHEEIAAIERLPSHLRNRKRRDDLLAELDRMEGDACAEDERRRKG